MAIDYGCDLPLSVAFSVGQSAQSACKLRLMGSE